MSLSEELSRGIAQIGVEVKPAEQQKLLDYLVLLQKWNKVYNLTAVRKPEQMISHHLLDSLVVLPHLWFGHWLDVGCGAGLPGIILAIIRPEWTFTMLDSNSKKTSFVQQASIELDLKNIKIQCARVEEWQSGKKFDGIISRAFAKTSNFVSLTRHLLAKNGRWVAMKRTPEQELQHLPESVMIEKIIFLQVPNLDAARCLVVLKDKND